jgi:enamine deaminase RidA (YjgF/YER057c/UK114 family)
MAKRTSFHLEGFHPGQPIPVATRIGNIVMTGLVPASDPVTKAFAPDADGQIVQMFTNLEAMLGVAGASLDDVIRVTIYVKDRAIRTAINPIWITYFPDEHSSPARATMPNDNLAGDALVQCEAMAVIA